MKFEILKERDSPPNYKVGVNRLEVKASECVGMSLAGYRDVLRKKLLGNGFNLKKRITKFENLEKMTIVYEQRKYIIPKRKKV